jgi:hypothetical protein
MTVTRIPTSLCVALVVALAALAAASGASRAASRADIKEIVVEEARATTVPPSLALAVAKVESDFQVRALSPKGARGVMQIMPATAKGEFGVAADELWNARLNVQLGIDFLARLIKRYDGRWDLALSHYNGGRVMGSGAHAAPLPATRGYVSSVLRWQQRYAAQARVWRAAATRAAWTPATTPARTLPRTPIVTRARAAAPRTTIVRTRPDRAPSGRSRSRWHHIDGSAESAESAESIEQRRLRLRHLLDDFATGRRS